MTNLLTISTLYPNNQDPKHGIFVENRLRHLIKHYPELKPFVIAPVPWFPFKSDYFKEYQKYVGVDDVEFRNGIEIHHPRFIVIPKIGMLIAPFTMAMTIYWCLRKRIKSHGKPDLVDGHYFYPDGVAIALVCKWLNIPFTCTARGTDINLIADMTIPRKLIQWCMGKAKKSMAVCQALTNKLQELGAKNPVTLRNGVDLDFFTALPQSERRALKAELAQENKGNRILLSVGWLIERKGHHLVIQAMRSLPEDFCLYIAGNGPDEEKLNRMIEELHLSERVKLLGSLDQLTLKKYYQISDALVLASSREGWANVLLESMACGTPVVATNIWGTPEVVQIPEAGELVEREDEAIAKGIIKLFECYPDREKTRAYAEQFDWQATSDGQIKIFNDILNIRNE